VKFTKMEGLGNDYVYVNGFEETVHDPATLAVRMSDRHYGVGSDGLILILPSETADARMEMYNADGSRAEMCGNGIRCVARYVYEHRIAHKEQLVIETDAGPKRLDLDIVEGRVERIRVGMGKPTLERTAIPMNGPPGRVVDEPLEVCGQTLRVTAVNMGNPHCVTFVDCVNEADVEGLGPKIATHASFPAGVNAEFVEVVDRTHLGMRVWERGSGETLACGTGACAACVAAALNDLAVRAVTVGLAGGELQVEWDKGSDEVLMTGPAREVFTGDWPEAS
jgi:diaminopimelate epimerase